MKNRVYAAETGEGLKIKLPLPTTAQNGIPTTYGPSGLRVVPQTDVATAALRAVGKVPQGLKDGEASCVLPGITMVLDLGTLPAGVAGGQAIYREPDGDLTLTATADFVGYALPIAAPRSGWGVGIPANTAPA
ncbi:hypothetical protein [Deinococcus radiotolerans]|uniref:Uncharacterized protein n=1 Tax=Deinococcus radiotolerans TaxID=1309407 RepID=A0ABQ2FR05_9DEIO|nr:hypothetical protein [Deinococcus radiotolerans]GGL18403.1 hypothetical protein GCM10010844_41540 [Deinococcus radiotolerans]